MNRYRRRRWALRALLAAVLVVIASCPDGGPEVPLTLGDVLEVLYDGAVVTHGTTACDCGVVNPDAESGPTETVTLHNKSSSTTVTASSVTLSADTDFTLLVEGDLVLGPGDTTDLSLTFLPASSGQKTVTVSVDVQDMGVLQFDVTGEGNYPPVVSFEVALSGAGSPEVNGTYVWDGTVGTLGNYVLEAGVSAYLYPANVAQCGQDWYVADGPDGDGVELYWANENCPCPIPAVGWAEVEGASPVPTVTIGADGVHSEGSNFDPYSDLTVTFAYHDVEDDPVESVHFQWQKAGGAGGGQPDGVWVDVGTDTDTYVMEGAEFESWMRVIVTPRAASGIQDGASVVSPPVYIDCDC